MSLYNRLPNKGVLKSKERDPKNGLNNKEDGVVMLGRHFLNLKKGKQSSASCKKSTLEQRGPPINLHQQELPFDEKNCTSISSNRGDVLKWTYSEMPDLDHTIEIHCLEPQKACTQI